MLSCVVKQAWGAQEPRPHPDLGLHHFEDARRCSLVEPLRIPHSVGPRDDGREQVTQAGALAGQAAALRIIAPSRICARIQKQILEDEAHDLIIRIVVRTICASA